MIQIGRMALTCSDREHDVAALRREFDRVHCIRIRQFLSADLLQFVQEGIARAEFQERDHSGIGIEQCMVENEAIGVLHLLINDPHVLELLRQITGCESIDGFSGRVYRMVPASGHFDSWHTDLTGTRMVGMSLNLSRGAYKGGLFQLRAMPSKQMLVEIANTGEGDAIFFRIREDLAHRVSDVEGEVAKTAFAGWFTEEAEFASLFKTASSHSPQSIGVPAALARRSA